MLKFRCTATYDYQKTTATISILLHHHFHDLFQCFVLLRLILSSLYSRLPEFVISHTSISIIPSLAVPPSHAQDSNSGSGSDDSDSSSSQTDSPKVDPIVGKLASLLVQVAQKKAGLLQACVPSCAFVQLSHIITPVCAHLVYIFDHAPRPSQPHRHTQVISFMVCVVACLDQSTLESFIDPAYTWLTVFAGKIDTEVNTLNACEAFSYLCRF